MEVPRSRRFVIRVIDEQDQVVRGAQMWAYWGWADISLRGLEQKARGRGLGRQLMQAIENKAQDCVESSRAMYLARQEGAL